MDYDFDNLKENFDLSLALIGASLSILLIVYFILVIDRIIYTLVGFFVLSSCMIWILIRKKADLRQLIYGNNSFIARFSNLLSYLFIFISIILLALACTPYVRPLTYFIFTSLAACAIAFEILYFRGNKKHTYFILFKIALIGVSLELSQQLIFPSLVGVDPWYHQSFTTAILNLAHIPSGWEYSDFPIFHIGLASAMLMTNATYKISSMLFGVGQVILDALFVFLIGKNIFPKHYNIRLGLLAALLVIIANYPVQSSFWLIPNALGWIFAIMIIYLLFIHKKKGQNTTIISIITMAVLIFTHTLASFGLAMLLIIGWFVYYLHLHLHINSKEIQFPRKLTIFLVIGMFSVWIYAYWPLSTLVSLVLSGFNQAFFEPLNAAVTAYATSISVVEQILNQISLFLFFTLSFIGGFYMISKKYGNYFTRIIAIMGIAPLVISFFILISGGSILGERWWCLAEIIGAIPASISFLLIVKIKNKPIKIMSFAGLIIFLSFFSMISPIANIDSHAFSPNSNVRYALTDSELQSLNVFFYKWDGTFGADQYYETAIANLGHPIISIDQELYNKNFNDTPNNTLILIRSEIVSSPIMAFSGIYKLNYDPSTLLQNLTFDKIYACNSVNGFLK